MRYIQIFLIIQMIVFFSHPAAAQDERASEAKKQQIKQLESLSFMDGIWRGPAWIILPTGERTEMTQTERVGPLLGGSVKVVEGRGYDEGGTTVFNAFAVIAYDSQKKQLMMRSYTNGRGDFVFNAKDDGYTWEIPAGPATIRYSAKITDSQFFEYGERIVGDKPPFRFFEMKLQRLSDSDWPAGGSVPPK